MTVEQIEAAIRQAYASHYDAEANACVPGWERLAAERIAAAPQQAAQDALLESAHVAVADLANVIGNAAAMLRAALPAAPVTHEETGPVPPPEAAPAA